MGGHLAVRYLSSELESGQAMLEREISEPDSGLQMVESHVEAPQQLLVGDHSLHQAHQSQQRD